MCRANYSINCHDIIQAFSFILGEGCTIPEIVDTRGIQCWITCNAFCQAFFLCIAITFAAMLLEATETLSLSGTLTLKRWSSRS